MEDALNNLDRGRALPESLQWLAEEEPPPTSPGDEFYFTAFWQLGTGRQLGMGVGPIPWRDIDAYGQRYGLDADMLHDFTQVILALDQAYLTWKAEQAERR